MALACKRKIKSLVGVGWCGALAHQVNVGDVVIPIAAVRDENTSDHYVDKRYPSVADFRLAQLVSAIFEEIAPEIRVHKGIIITISSTFTESPEWGETWSSRNVIAVECETSVIYTLASLIGISAVNILVVSDHVTRTKSCDQDELSAERVRKAFDSALKVAYEATVENAVSLIYKRALRDSEDINETEKRQPEEKSSLKDLLDW